MSEYQRCQHNLIIVRLSGGSNDAVKRKRY